MKKKKIIAFAALLMASLFLFAACGNGDTGTPATGGEQTGGGNTGNDAATGGVKGTIAFVNYVNAHPYFTAARDRAIAAGAELGYEVIYSGTADVDTPRFLNLVEDFIAQGVDALVVAALDDSVSPLLRQAQAQGITVITWDVDLQDAAARQAYTAMGDYIPFTGSGIAESLINNIGDSGTYVLIDGEPSMQIIIDRGDYIVKYIQDKYPGVTMLAREIAGEDSVQALAVAQNLLTLHPDVDAILVNTSSALMPAAQAVVDFGLVGKCFVAGEGFADMVPPFFELGVGDSVYTWDTAEWADFSVRVAVKFIEGVDIPQGGNLGISGFPNATRHDDHIYYNSPHIFLTPDMFR